MSFIENLTQKVLARPGRLVLPEGDDPRVIRAARELVDRGLVKKIFLLAEAQTLKTATSKLEISLDGITVEDPENSDKLEEMAQAYHELRKHKGITLEKARFLVEDPLTYGALLVRLGYVDGMVAGSVYSTAEVLRAAIVIVRPQEGIKTVSSCFAMLTPQTGLGIKGGFIYSDCGAVPNPDSEQLADIAQAAAKSCRQLFGVEPIVAMLAFSTKGSAVDPSLEKVIEATKIVKERAPELVIDGELQADAAIIPEIGRKKAPDSPAAGLANTLIFPDLNSGNIAYKLTERLTGGEAYGPLLQGLRKPVNDLSRGCKTSDIVNVSIITLVQGMKD